MIPSSRRKWVRVLARPPSLDEPAAAAAAAADRDDVGDLIVGDSIEARHRGGAYYYPAIVLRRHAWRPVAGGGDGGAAALDASLEVCDVRACAGRAASRLVGRNRSERHLSNEMASMQNPTTPFAYSPAPSRPIHSDGPKYDDTMTSSIVAKANCTS